MDGIEKESKQEMYFWPSCFCIIGQDMWFVYGKIAILCKYNLTSKETEIVGCIPVNEMYQESLFSKIIYANKKLFLIPCHSKNIVVYDMIKKDFKSIFLSDSKSLNFCSAYLFGKDIVCAPYQYPRIISIDTNTYEIKETCNLAEEMRDKGISYFNDAERIGNDIFMVSPQSEVCFIYNLYTGLLNYHVVQNVKGIEAVSSVKDKIIFSSSNTKTIGLYELPTLKCIRTMWVESKDRLVVRSYSQNLFLVDDPGSNEVMAYDSNFNKIFELTSGWIRNRGNYYSFLTGIAVQGYYFDQADVSLKWIENDTVKSAKISVPQKDNIKVIRYLAKKNTIMVENKFINVNGFLKSII